MNKMKQNLEDIDVPNPQNFRFAYRDRLNLINCKDKTLGGGGGGHFWRMYSWQPGASPWQRALNPSILEHCERNVAANVEWLGIDIPLSRPSNTGGGPRVVDSTAAFHARVRSLVPGLGGLKETKMFLPHPRVKVSIVGSLRDREVTCSASDRQGSNFESCVWRTVSSQSSHHPQGVLLAQFSLYMCTKVA